MPEITPAVAVLPALRYETGYNHRLGWQYIAEFNDEEGQYNVLLKRECDEVYLMEQRKGDTLSLKKACFGGKTGVNAILWTNWDTLEAMDPMDGIVFQL